MVDEPTNLLRQQIEAILSKVEDKSSVEAMISLAHNMTAFILECEADGLERYEAIILARTWIENIIKGSSSGRE